MKRLRFAILCLTTAIFFIACRRVEPGVVSQPGLGQPGAAVVDNSSVAALLADLPAAQADVSRFPVTVENCDRTLTFTQPPQRAMGLWQPPNEMLLILGRHGGGRSDWADDYCAGGATGWDCNGSVWEAFSSVYTNRPAAKY